MTFKRFVLVLTLVSSLSLKDSVILTSSFTPEPLKQLCNELAMIKIDNESLTSSTALLSKLDFLFLVDFTYSQSFSSILNSISEHFQVPYLSIFESTTKANNRIEIHSDIKSEAEGIQSLISALKLTSFTIITSSNIRDLDLASYLKSGTKNEFFTYTNNISDEFANNFVLKILKSSGVNTVILIDSSESFSKFEQALVYKNWMKSGSIIINSARTPSHLKTVGTLQVAEIGTEGFSSIHEFHFNAVSNFVQVFNQKLEKTGELTRSVLLQKVKDFNVELNIVNFQPDVKVVGEYNRVKREVNIQSSIVFPGNTTSFKVQTKSQIAISIANGTHDPYYSKTYNFSAYLFKGANYAVYRSNFFNEIQNFELVLSPSDCGIFWYDPYWYQTCFSRILPSMGVGLITSFFTAAIKGNIYSLRALNHTLPQVSPLGANYDLESKENFPELVRLDSNPGLHISSQFLTLKNLGFNDVVVIASNQTLRINRYLEYKEFIEDSGMRIINDESSRFIDHSYTRENFTLYEDVFKKIKDTYCTVFIILIPNLGMVLEALYDVGLRKGDFITATFDANSINILVGVENPYFNKRKELIEGSLLTSYREWVGTLGSTLQKELSMRYIEIGYMCMTYDTVSVFKEAIKYVLSIGEDIESYSTLMKAIRINRFTGCLGNVFFSNDANSRSSAQLLFQQLYYNETMNIFKTKDVLYFDRFGAQLNTQINSFKWPNDEKPANYRPISECGFEPREEQNSFEGKKVLYIISAVLFAGSVISGLACIWCCQEKFEVLIERKLISLGDMIVYAFFALEFFQIITMGPDQDAYSHLVGNFQILLSSDLNSYFSFKFDKFWLLFYAIFSVSLTCTIIFLMKLTKLESLIPNVIQNTFQFLAKSLLLIIGHLLFLPTVSMLFNIFSCYRSTGDNLTDSFLENDCKTNCYTGTHKSFAIYTFLVLFLFISLGTFYRPSLQYLNPYQNVKTKSKFIVFQTWVQLALVIFKKTLKIENQTTHGIVIIIVLIWYLVGTYTMKPYNFQRPLIGHCFFIIGALWTAITSVLYREVGSQTAWVIVEFVGLALISIIGMIIFKRSKEMLYSVKGKNISNLFLFQCYKNDEKYIYDSESIDFLSDSKYHIGDSLRQSI